MDRNENTQIIDPNVDRHSFDAIKNVVTALLSNKILAEKLIFAGGIVPYLLSGQDSGRLHNDIDIIGNINDMDIIRNELKKMDLYKPQLDSINFNGADGKDFGFDVFIDNVPVGFYPYKMTEKGDFVQRSCPPPGQNTSAEIKQRVIPGIAESDIITKYPEFSTDSFNHLSLELLFLSKETAERPKDIADIEAIKRAGEQKGYDLDKYNRIKGAWKHQVWTNQKLDIQNQTDITR